MKQDHQELRQEWRQDRARDAFREARMDEERLQELAIRKERDDLQALREASRLYKKGGQ